MGTTHHDSEWLDLVADLVGRPLTSWPVQQVLPVLARSFDAPAASFYGQAPSSPLGQEAWPPDLYRHQFDDVVRWGREDAPREHPLLRYYLATGRPDVMQVADVPERFADRWVHERWRAVCDDLLGGDVVSQVSLPVCLGPLTNRSFLVGRVDPYSADDLVLLRRLRRLFEGLDRQIAAHARWADRTGEHAVPTAQEAGLTPRESAVLDLLASGCTARAIARRLRVGERTVQKHLQRIYRKLGAGDRLVAVQRAQFMGLLPVPSST